MFSQLKQVVDGEISNFLKVTKQIKFEAQARPVFLKAG